FYTNLIELAWPWTVKSVAANEGSESVDVYLECAEAAQFACPHCDLTCPVCDYSPSKSWRHLDTCRKMTFLHARLPVLDCPEHGKQQTRIPWADADSPFTAAFEKWIGGLAEGFGDAKKAAHFAGVEYVLVRRLLRRAAEEVGEAKGRPAGGHEAISPTRTELQPGQISLFAQNMSFVNQGIHAFNNLELEEAVDLFRKHRSRYPKGYDISSRLKAAEFLIQGMREAPAEPGERPGYLCRLWDSFEDYVRSEGTDGDLLAARAKGAYFARVLQEVERAGLAESTMLPEDIPLGYILLQAGRYDEAIRSLQDRIPKMPHAAALYGWLGEAYRLRGDHEVARRCYREACLIDPAAIDWRHIEDAELKELKQDILFEYDFDPELAIEWLPSHARLDGLFERKPVRLNDGLKEMVDDYLAMEKAWSKDKSPRLAAKLFLRGMVLCENRDNLKFVKKIDLIQVRRTMKQANADLFEEFLEKIVEGRTDRT
ncbi:MAG: tetratricopeptide repeat protein, partial [Syntrophobacteraceae bacterium]